jgi:plasmid stabilization system protein ParE
LTLRISDGEEIAVRIVNELRDTVDRASELGRRCKRRRDVGTGKRAAVLMRLAAADMNALGCRYVSTHTRPHLVPKSINTLARPNF